MNFELFHQAVERDQRAAAASPRTHNATCPCQDCYFERMGEELERHPISALRIVRGGCMGDDTAPAA